MVRPARTSRATTERTSSDEPEKSTDHEGAMSWCTSQLSTLSPVTCLTIHSETTWFPKTTTSTAVVTVPVNERERVMATSYARRVASASSECPTLPCQ